MILHFLIVQSPFYFFVKIEFHYIFYISYSTHMLGMFIIIVSPQGAGDEL